MGPIPTQPAGTTYSTNLSEPASVQYLAGFVAGKAPTRYQAWVKALVTIVVMAGLAGYGAYEDTHSSQKAWAAALAAAGIALQGHLATSPYSVPKP